MNKPLILLTALALASFSLAACGGDDDSDSSTASTTESTTEADSGGGGGGGAVTVTAAADGSFAFDQTSLDAPAGATTFTFENPASLGHDFCLEQDGSEVGCTDVISGSDTADLEADLEPGEYTYYCSVDGHRAGGMEGTLNVN
ncbi:MAG: plastocyanin/azurin family copper-binding protein [bacterium]